MAQSLLKNELGNGLPLCLSSLLKLQKPLYLSGQLRHRILQGVWVRSRIGADIHAETDEAVLLAFYSDPQNRRELWDHWRASPPPAAPVLNRTKARRHQDGPPPSLEYCILDNLDRNLLRSESSDDVIVDRLREEVNSRLNRWSEADSAERRQAVRLAFTLASLQNDQSVLQEAVERVEDLEDEFEKLLRPPAVHTSPDAEPETPGAAPTEFGVPAARPDAPNRELLQVLQKVETTIDSAFSSVHGLVEKIEDAESLEILGGFATGVEDRVQTLHGGLTARRRNLESRRTVEELQATAAGFLAEVAKHAAAAGIQGDVDELVNGWADMSSVHPKEALAELARLRNDVPVAIATLKQAHEEYGRIGQELDSLQECEPTSREEQRTLDGRLDALLKQRLAARNRHRAAEDALLTALAPSVCATDPSAPAATQVGEPAFPDSQSNATGDPSDGAAAEEAPAHANEGVSAPPTGEAGSEAGEVKSRDVVTEQGPQAGPAVAPTEADRLDPPEERVQPAEPDESKTETVPATSVSAAEPAAADGTAPEGTVEDEPREAPPEPPTLEWSEVEQSVRNALADALADEPPRLAEAFQVCRLAEELEIAAGQPRSAIVEAALYASHLRQAHGELAADLREVIENAPSEPPPGSTPAQENAEALLRFAGAVVPALLAPHTGAAAWLKGLTHEGLLALYDFAQHAAERSWAAQTAGIDAGSFLRRAGRHLKHGDAMAAVQQDLASWLEGDATLPLGYVPAKKVWSGLLKKGPLGRLLRAISNRTDAANVRKHLAEIQDRDRLRKCLDDLSAQLLKKSQSIDQKIFKQIRRRLDRPCELAHEYLDLCEATTDQASYHRQILSDFVRLIQEDAPGLHEELQTVKARQDEDPLVRAATNVASSALIQVENLVDPELEAGGTGEPAADMVRASGLFLYPQVRIADSGLAEGDADEALMALFSAPASDVETALERHIEAADLQTAQRILDWPMSAENMGDDDAERWQERLDSSREEHLRSLKEDAETLRDALESAFLYGQLEPADRLEIDVDLSSLEDRIEGGTVARFDRSVAELDRLRRTLESARDESLQALRNEARGRVPANEPDRLREIERHIDDGDLVAANELLYRPSETTQRTLRVHSDSVELLDSYLAADRAGLRIATKDWTKVVEAAKAGRRHGDLAFDELDEDDRASASELIESWSNLRNCRRLNRAEVAKAARELFSRLGLSDVRVRLDRNATRATPDAWTGELLTATLSDRGDCAIAQFGSLARGRYRVLVCFDEPTATQVRQALEGAYAGQAAIVVCALPLRDSIREQLTRTSFEKKLPFLLLDQLLLTFLALQVSPRPASFFALSLPFSYCKAFQTRSSFVPPEMFFGREREMSEVRDFDDGSCFLYGGRQLGKTALLRRVQEEFTTPQHGRFAVWIDLKDGGIGDADTADIWAVIWKHLRELEAIDETVRRPTRDARSVETFCEALHARFNPRTRGKLLILLDEADNFLRRDALNSSRATFSESSRLKALMERYRSIKVVFAGLHNVLRTTNQSNHPLAHMGTPICIGPFIQPEERRQAEDLLSVPLQACGYRFEPQRLMRSVLARANYYPSLLQIHGNELAVRLSQPTRHNSLTELPAVRPDLLAGVHRDREFQAEIRKRFEWTLQLDPRYEAIAYVLAFMCHDNDRVLHEGADVGLLFSGAREWWEAGFGDGFDSERFRALLEEMVELGVLRRTETQDRTGERFSLRNPNVLALLGSVHDLDEKLVALEGLPATSELGPREIRRRNGEKGPLYRPLTLQQEHALTGVSEKGSSRNEVVLVCGTEAAGVGHVTDFLLAGPGLGEVERLKPSRSVAAFERDLRSRLNARKPGTTVFLADANAGAWCEDWIMATRGILDKLRSRDRLARVVFSLDADRLMTHRRAIRQFESQGTLLFVDLQPWSIGFAAACLDDDRDVGHRLDQKQERELAELAGGWPVLLDLVLQALRDGASPELLTKPAGFHELSRENASRLMEAFALDHVELAAVLHLARELGTATENELLDPEARELAACPLGKEELRSAIWAARKLHLLQPTGPSEWRVNPIVAAMLQTSLA